MLCLFFLHNRYSHRAFIEQLSLRGPLKPGESDLLNYITKSFLLSMGYKMTAISFAEEVGQTLPIFFFLTLSFFCMAVSLCLDQ